MEPLVLHYSATTRPSQRISKPNGLTRASNVQTDIARCEDQINKQRAASSNTASSPSKPAKKQNIEKMSQFELKAQLREEYGKWTLPQLRAECARVYISDISDTDPKNVLVERLLDIKAAKLARGGWRGSLQRAYASTIGRIVPARSEMDQGVHWRSVGYAEGDAMWLFGLGGNFWGLVSFWETLRGRKVCGNCTTLHWSGNCIGTLQSSRTGERALRRRRKRVLKLQKCSDLQLEKKRRTLPPELRPHEDDRATSSYRLFSDMRWRSTTTTSPIWRRTQFAGRSGRSWLAYFSSSLLLPS